MNGRIQITDEVLRSLADAAGPCITIVLPKALARDFATRRTIAFRQAREALRKYECDADGLMEPVEHLAANAPAGSMLILRTPNLFQHWVTQAPVTGQVTVEDHFPIRQLLHLKDLEREYYILALSLKRIRLLRCTNLTAEEVELPPGTEVKLAEELEFRRPDHTGDNMVSGGPSTGSMRGVMFSTSSAADSKDEYLEHDFIQLARSVQTLLKDTGAPLVLVGVDQDLALFRRANTAYPNLVEPGVSGAPDAFLGTEMQERALELVRLHLPPAVEKALAGFDKMVGTGHASTHAQEIVKAAHEGRIMHLFLRPGAEYRGAYDAVRQKVKRHDDGVEPLHDLLNDAAMETLRHGGSVHSIPSDKMPHGVGVAAIFRYSPREAVGVAGAQAES